jgi:hypothetical protein
LNASQKSIYDTLFSWTYPLESSLTKISSKQVIKESIDTSETESNAESSHISRISPRVVPSNASDISSHDSHGSSQSRNFSNIFGKSSSLQKEIDYSLGDAFHSNDLFDSENPLRHAPQSQALHRLRAPSDYTSAEYGISNRRDILSDSTFAMMNPMGSERSSVADSRDLDSTISVSADHLNNIKPITLSHSSYNTGESVTKIRGSEETL